MYVLEHWSGSFRTYRTGSYGHASPNKNFHMCEAPARTVCPQLVKIRSTHYGIST